jgi:carbonic anhydrase
MEFDRDGTTLILVDVLEANAVYAERFAHGTLSNRPKRQMVVITCMDSRMDPVSFLGLNIGDAQIVRNAGGRVTEDTIRSLVISQRMLGSKDILIVHHTDCGLLGMTNESIRSRVAAEARIDVSDMDFHPITDLESSVREDAEALRRSPLIRRDSRISGFIYDVRTGRLRHVT